jgi:hypothetical protein
VANNDCVVTDQNLFDQEPNDPLAFLNVQMFCRGTQP